jgi:predicted GIY-YIG superfamily endonuclease
MFHVYVIISDTHSDRCYIGFSSRPHDRLTEHNAGKNPSTAGFAYKYFIMKHLHR